MLSHDVTRLEEVLPGATADVVNALAGYTWVDPDDEEPPQEVQMTALQYTINGELEPMFKALLACGLVDVNTVNEYGYTALHEAASSDDAMYTRDLLKQTGIDANVQDDYRYSPLHYAVIVNRSTVATLLLARTELNIEAEDVSGDTALDLAVEYKRQAIANLIRAETARRVRVTRVARLMSLRQRIEDGVAAPTDATRDLLGPVGAFAFNRERCLIELVPEILLFAAGDPFVPTSGPQFNGACFA